MQVDDVELAHLFTMFQRLHRLTCELMRAILKSEDATIPPLGFLWLIQSWEDTWDIGVHTNIFNIDTSALDRHVEIEVDDVQALKWYLNISQEYQWMTFKEPRARALQPHDPVLPLVDVAPVWDLDSPEDTD